MTDRRAHPRALAVYFALGLTWAAFANVWRMESADASILSAEYRDAEVGDKIVLVVRGVVIPTIAWPLDAATALFDHVFGPGIRAG